MSEREDVEAHGWHTHETWPNEIWRDKFCPDPTDPERRPLHVYTPAELATHDEQVRADALAPVRALAEGWEAEVQSVVTGPSTGSVDRWVAIVRDRTRGLRAALPPERLAGEVGEE